jgi:hypothetical protein
MHVMLQTYSMQTHCYLYFYYTNDYYSLGSALSTSVQLVNAQHKSTDVKQANNALALLANVVWSLPVILSPLCIQSSYPSSTPKAH